MGREQTLQKGDEWMLLLSQARTADTNTDDVMLIAPYGLEIMVDVDAAASGIINAVNVQEKASDGLGYDTRIAFTGLTLNAAGRSAFLIHPEGDAAANWTAVKKTVPPKIFRLNIDHANDIDSITYSVKVRAL